MTTNYKYLFGPITSRRLGISLGVDLIPFKTCSFNCVYCECGLTTELTNEKQEFYPTDKIKAELFDYLSTNPELDYITYSGSGEPTLHSDLLEISRFIKENFPQYKICLITNSSTMLHDDFRNQLIHEGHSDIDLIMPSLDAVTQDVFTKIDQPEGNIQISDLCAALTDFSQRYDGKIWLEIFILPGVNDTDSELEKFVEVLQKMSVDRILLNCLDRTPPYDWVKTATQEQMERVKEKLSSLGVEIQIVGKIASSNADERFASGD